MKRPIGAIASVLCWLCLGASASPRADTDPSACTIMTKADVESVLHVAVQAGAPMTGQAASLLPKGARSCVYKRPGAPNVSMLASISVAMADPSMFDTLLQNYHSPELAALGFPKPVPGLGEKAAYIPVAIARL
ncbi:MAG TPA: hypothetical protein VGY48_30845 [Vicinamibacterales bacterium]|nr:hypothetical protein [Vicinamibacterales bacterium]